MELDKGQWMQLKGKLREQSGRLTDDEIDQLQGNVEVLIGKIQERYERSREQAEQEFDRWMEQQGRAAERTPLESMDGSAVNSAGPRLSKLLWAAADRLVVLYRPWGPKDRWPWRLRQATGLTTVRRDRPSA